MVKEIHYAYVELPSVRYALRISKFFNRVRWNSS